jgi:small subunit ribosomal protein S9
VSTNYVYGTGRRKTAVARVRLLPGDGSIVVNGKPASEYFGGASPEGAIQLPFRVTETEGRYSASVLVAGGGVSGQAGAIRHGIARALLSAHPNARAALRGAADPRSAGQGAQEVRPEARPQGAAVHEALTRAASDTTRREPRSPGRMAGALWYHPAPTQATRQS